MRCGKCDFTHLTERLPMSAIVNIYSEKPNEIKNFIDKFYDDNFDIENNLEYEIIFENPVVTSDIIGAFIDNNDKFDIHMWLSLDKNIFINVTNHNADKIIRYLFERYPY